MEVGWIEHVNALRTRLQHNDATLTHLQPFPSDSSAEQSSATDGNSDGNRQASRGDRRISSIWSASSTFHMMILLDDLQVQAALARLWETCMTSQNSNIQRVTFPAAWPISEMRRALVALGELEGLRRVDIVANAHHLDSDEDDENVIFSGNSSLRGWHATPLEITRDFLPFLERRVQLQNASLRVPAATCSSLRHLRIDSRIMIRTQAEIDQLATVFSQLVRIKFLSLFLASKSAGTETMSLNPLFQELSRLSRRIPQQQAESETGLQILCLQWADHIHTHQAAVSPDVLQRFLLHQIEGSEAVSTMRKLSLCGLYLGSVHLEAVAKALRKNVILEDLKMSGHNLREGGVTPSSLQAILGVLENQNHTLKNISVYSPNEDQALSSSSRPEIFSSHRLLMATLPIGVYQDSNPMVPWVASAPTIRNDGNNSANDSEDEEDDHARCCRLQEQMDIFCRLNRLGRASLVSPNATSNDWIKIITRCTGKPVGTSSIGNNSSSSLFGCVNFLLEDEYDYKKRLEDEMNGLNEIFLLLRTYPSLCYAGERPVFDATVPPELERSRTSLFEGNSFKDFNAPTTSVTKALAIDWQKQHRLKEQEIRRNRKKNRSRPAQEQQQQQPPRPPLDGGGGAI